MLELQKIILDKFNNNQDGRLLASFGELFSQNIKVYVYPALDPETKMLVTALNMNIPDKIKFLYHYLIDSKQIIPVKKYEEKNLHIYPNDVLNDIRNAGSGWEQKVPKALVDLIKEKRLFGFSSI